MKQAALKQEEEIPAINPAITNTVLIVGGIPVPVPVCIHCLDVPEAPITPQAECTLVDPFTGSPIKR